MKKKQFLFSLIFLFLVTVSFAQKVTYQNIEYTVKGKSIYLSDKNVTENLSKEMVTDIFAHHKINKQKEKDLKKAERNLKKKVKAKTKLNKAKNKLESAVKKHRNLKEKGDLSPNEDKKWLLKIQKLKTNIIKAEKRFKKA